MAFSGDINQWLEAAARYPLLSAAEELHLGTLVQRGQQPDATPAEKRAAARAKDRMIKCNLRLVVAASRRFLARLKATSALSHEDLLQEGVIGLNRAVEKFDPEAGYKLSTYAYWWVRQSISRALEVQGNAIYLPNGTQSWIYKLRIAPPEVTASDEAIQEYLGLTDLQMRTLRLALMARRPISLDQRICNEGDELNCLGELIPDPHNQPSTDQLDYELAIAAVSAAVDPEELDWMLDAAEGATIRTIAHRNGIKPSRMSQMVNQARRKARLAAGPEVQQVLAA